MQLESNTPTVNEKPQLAESQRYVSYGRLRDAFVFSAQDKDAIKLMLMENKDVSDFLNLLDDDYLVSPLSAAHYESKSKKRLDKDE